MALKVLLADDSTPAQNMGKKILVDAGYEVLTVSNGLEALRKIAEAIPDIAILDIFMPGYSGLEICARLRADAATAELPVILTVGKLEPYRAEDGEEVGSNAILVKPFCDAELTSVVCSLIGAAPDEAPPMEPAADPPCVAHETAAIEPVSAKAELQGPESVAFHRNAAPCSASVAEPPPSASRLPAEVDAFAPIEFDLEPAASPDVAGTLPAASFASWLQGPEVAGHSADARGSLACTAPFAIAAKSAIATEIIEVEAPHRAAEGCAGFAPGDGMAECGAAEDEAPGTIVAQDSAANDEAMTATASQLDQEPRERMDAVESEQHEELASVSDESCGCDQQAAAVSVPMPQFSVAATAEVQEIAPTATAEIELETYQLAGISQFVAEATQLEIMPTLTQAVAVEDAPMGAETESQQAEAEPEPKHMDEHAELEHASASSGMTSEEMTQAEISPVAEPMQRLGQAEQIQQAVEKVFERFRPLLVAAIVRELTQLD